MYIEVFLLDNLLMNAVICVLAGAVCGRRIRPRRVLLFSLCGAAYGAAAMYVPTLSLLPCKLLLCLAMALVFPYEGLRGYMAGLAAMLAAALTVGGLGFLLICSFGSVKSLGYGIPLRIMLLTALSAWAMPGVARRVRGKRLDNQNRHVLILRRGDREYALDAMVDSGNSLHDPVSGRPVAVAWLPEKGDIPIPAGTVSESSVLYAFRPDSALLDGSDMDILVAVSKRPLRAALIPPAALYDELIITRLEGKYRA